MKKILFGIALFLLVFIPFKVRAIQPVVWINGEEIDFNLYEPISGTDNVYSFMDGKVILDMENIKMTLNNYEGGSLYFETDDTFSIEVKGNNTIDLGTNIFGIGSSGGVDIYGTGNLTITKVGEADSENAAIVYGTNPGTSMSVGGTENPGTVKIRNNKTTISNVLTGIYTLGSAPEYDDALIQTDLTVDALMSAIDLYGKLVIKDSTVKVTSMIGGISAVGVDVINSDIKINNEMLFLGFNCGLGAYYGGGININNSTLDITVAEGSIPILVVGSEDEPTNGGLTLDNRYEAVVGNKRQSIKTITYVSSSESTNVVTTFADGEFVYEDDPVSYIATATSGVGNHLIIRLATTNPDTGININSNIYIVLGSLLSIIVLGVLYKRVNKKVQ